MQLLYLARAVLAYVPLIRADPPSVLHAVDLPMFIAAILIAPLAGRPRIVYDAFEIYSIMESSQVSALAPLDRRTAGAAAAQVRRCRADRGRGTAGMVPLSRRRLDDRGELDRPAYRSADS